MLDSGIQQVYGLMGKEQFIQSLLTADTSLNWSSYIIWNLHACRTGVSSLDLELCFIIKTYNKTDIQRYRNKAVSHITPNFH